MSEPARVVRPSGGGFAEVGSGRALDLPLGWVLLPPGDAAHTRRVKEAGDHWLVQEQRGRRVLSRGVLAPAERVERVRRALEQERGTAAYAQRLQASRERSQRQQGEYVNAFRAAVLAFVDFAPAYRDLAERLADAVSAHATPVGSGTVARTRRIPVEERAAAAVIAWLRHQTTGYDRLEIPRVRGKRRDVRRRLARRAHELLDGLRRGERIDPATCPLHRALAPRDPRAAAETGAGDAGGDGEDEADGGGVGSGASTSAPTPRRPGAAPPSPRAASASRGGPSGSAAERPQALWKTPLQRRG